MVNRLTDISRYPGSHKYRFDENGRGVGLNGRRSPRDVLAMLKESTKTFDPLGLLQPVPPKIGLSESDLRRRKLSDEVISRGHRIF